MRRVTWAAASLTVALTIAVLVAVVYHILATGNATSFLTYVALAGPVVVAFAIIGALVSDRRPHNPIGWIFLAVGLLNALAVVASAYDDLIPSLTAMENPPGAALMYWVGIWVWIPAIVLPTVFLFLLFPDGRLPSPRWRVISWAAVLGLALTIVGVALHPGPVDNWTDVEAGNPFGVAWAARALDVAIGVGQWLLALGFAGAIAAFAVRLKRSHGVEREQMKWLTYAFAVMLLMLILGSILAYAWPESTFVDELLIALTLVAILGIGLGASVAILRYRLFDIGLVINRTLVYGALTVSVITIYVLVVGGLSTLFQAQGHAVVALLATGVVAVLFHPLRERLQRGVNQFFYGQRDEPLEALSALGRRLEAAIAPDVVLSTLVETIAETLKSPYVAISLRTGDEFTVAAQTGEPASDTIDLPLIYQGETVGQLRAAPRAPGEDFSHTDRRLLENIAHQAGSAARAVQLTAALQQSRRQIVSAREEERRRLRRDLHDGLGATLAALHLEAGALRRSISSDPEKAEALVDEFRADIRASIDEIRRLVHDLRPPTLDQLGLVAAVRAQAAQCSRTEDLDSARLQVRVEAPEELPPLPAAVEVAAYRIVQEALTNIVRHAQARRCSIRLELSDHLEVEVVDDGRGLAYSTQRNGGVGLVSMRERAVELDGTCVVEAAPGGGTRVMASLPLTSTETDV